MSPIDPHTPLSGRDAALALGCGVIFAGLSAWLIAPQVMFTENLEPFISPNFGEYCEILGLWNDPKGDWIMQPLRRSMSASVPAHLFGNMLGVIDGLAAGALLCTIIMGASLYIWAGALGGRLAGVMAVVAALSTGTLSLMTRHFTFYPTIVACFVLASALCVWATRTPQRTQPVAVFCAASAVGASLLVDVRGIIWAAPMLLLLLLLVLGSSSWKTRLFGLLLVAAPIWVSHSLGRWNSGGMQVVTLEEQVDVRPLAYLHGARGPGLEPPFQYDSRFFWGVSKLTDLPKTIRFLANQFTVSGVEDIRDVRGLETVLFESKVDPCERGAVVALIIVLVGMRRDPKGLTALALTGAPYAAAQLGIHAHHEVRIRFLFQTLPLLAVLYGLAARHTLAWLLQAVGRTQDTPRARQARNHPELSPLWPAMGGALAVLITANCVGWIPGPLSMDAAWRDRPWHFVNGHISLYKRMVEEDQAEDVLAVDPWENNTGVKERWTFREATCDPLLSADHKRKGDAFSSRFYPPLDKHVERQVRPEVGFAPSMSEQRPR